MAQHNLLGKQGEDIAAKHFEDLGYTIVERNWVYKRIEIDIVACNDEFIVFVEVKTRSTDRWGNPEEAISESKMRRMIEVADYYVKEHDINTSVRFDVISLIKNENGFAIKHFDDAFLPPVN